MAAGKITQVYSASKKRGITLPKKALLVKVSGKKKKSKALVKTVKSVVRSLAENKVKQSLSTYDLRYMTTDTTDLMIQSNLIPLSPYPQAGLSAEECIEILQGQGSSTRNGNQIHTARAVFKCVLSPLKYHNVNNPNPTPHDVMIIIFKCKGVQGTGSFPDDLDGARHLLNNHCYQNNVGATQGSTGVNSTLATLIKEFNKDTIQILYKKIYKVGNQGIYTATDGAWRGDSQALGNNDYKMNHIITIDCTKYLNKIYRYDDNAGETSNKNVFLFALPIRADGDLTATYYNNTHRPVRMNWQYTYEYEDF